MSAKSRYRHAFRMDGPRETDFPEWHRAVVEPPKPKNTPTPWTLQPLSPRMADKAREDLRYLADKNGVIPDYVAQAWLEKQTAMPTTAYRGYMGNGRYKIAFTPSASGGASPGIGPSP